MGEVKGVPLVFSARVAGSPDTAPIKPVGPRPYRINIILCSIMDVINLFVSFNACGG